MNKTNPSRLLIRNLEKSTEHSCQWDGVLESGGLVRITSNGLWIKVETNLSPEIDYDCKAWKTHYITHVARPPLDTGAAFHSLPEILEMASIDLRFLPVPVPMINALDRLNHFLELDRKTISAIARCAVSAPAKGGLEMDDDILLMANPSKIGGSRTLSVLGLLNGALCSGRLGPWISRLHQDGDPNSLISSFEVVDSHGRMVPREGMNIIHLDHSSELREIITNDGIDALSRIPKQFGVTETMEGGSIQSFFRRSIWWIIPTVIGAAIGSLSALSMYYGVKE